MLIEEIKALLPVTYVLDAAGYQPAGEHANDVLYVVPWRSDSDPSLACYAGEGSDIVDRWSDMARGEHGDVLDLIQRLDPDINGVSAARELAMQLVFSDRFRGWVAPTPPQAKRRKLDLDAYRDEQKRRAVEHDGDLLHSWMLQRQDNVSDIPAEWLARQFRVVAGPDELRIPYYDRDGNEVAGKRRKYEGPALSLSGGDYSTLYGLWLDDSAKDVVLCEGESDVWSGTHAAGQDYVFLGLPSGAGYSKKVDLPASRRVLIALDGDEAGRTNIPKWAKALTERDCSVEIVPLPEGFDLSSYTAGIPALLRQARPFHPKLTGLLAVAGTYRRMTKDGDPGQAVSDFTLTVERVMVTEDGALSYEVSLDGRSLLLTADDLSSSKRMDDWANRHGRGWSGSQNDVVVLRNNLACDSMYVPTELASDIAGLYENHVVWEGGSMGPTPVRYVPRGVQFPLDIRLSEERPDFDELQALLALGASETMHPLLAWAAAAPVRSLVAQFPVLNVAGASGSGKTTLIEQVIPRLTGAHTLQTLSSTTPFAVEAAVNSTNAFPVVFDEYRPGARNDALVRLEQLARDAYNGIPSSKSAGGDRWHEVQRIRTEAPIVIAGEQSITETSHAERMILVHLTRPSQRDPQHSDALDQLRRIEPGRLAHRYLSWLLYEGLDHVTVIPASYPELPDRVRWNIGVLNMGWGLLDLWLTREGLDFLPAPDWSGFVRDVDEVTSTNPILDAIRYCVDQDRCELVWEDDEYVYVQATELIRWTRDLFVLPGNNARTINDFLRRQYGAEEAKVVPPTEFGGTRKRVLRVPLSRLVD